VAGGGLDRGAQLVPVRAVGGHPELGADAPGEGAVVQDEDRAAAGQPQQVGVAGVGDARVHGELPGVEDDAVDRLQQLPQRAVGEVVVGEAGGEGGGDVHALDA